MGTMESWRKAYGAIKDSTKVGLAKINSEFKVYLLSKIYKFSENLFSVILGFIYLKDLDVAVVKATNHVECPPKERHLRSGPSDLNYLFLNSLNLQS